MIQHLPFTPTLMTVKAVEKNQTHAYPTFLMNDSVVESQQIFPVSTEARTTLKRISKIGLKYPIKIQMSIKVTHNFSTAMSFFLFLIISSITFNDRNRRNSVSELPYYRKSKA